MAGFELARAALRDADYHLSVSLFEECLNTMEPSADIYLDYADALVQCGRLLDSLDVYSLCSRYTLVSADRLGRVVSTFTEMLQATGIPREDGVCGLGCAICESVLVQPTTLGCGHTFCAGCVLRDTSGVCRKCGAKVGSSSLETNVLVKKVVERWFHTEAKAARLREEGNRLCVCNKFEEAIAKYNAALQLVPSHLVYSNRSHTLYRLNRPQAALADAEAAIKLRPHWVKGHYRRGVVMAALGQHEEAFVSFALCVALDHNGETMRNELTGSLKRLLVPTSMSGRRLCVKSRWNSPYLSPSHFLPPVNTSDCEDNSSGEDEYQMQKKTIPKVQANRRLHKIFDRIFQEVNRLKKQERRPVVLQIDKNAVDPSDFDCILCCRALWRPVTTPCGHSYCAMCLERCMDYSTACPLCMTSLSNFVGVNSKNVTRWLEEALMAGLPEVYASRLLSHRQELDEQERSPEVPVFVCTTAFPTVPCPLFIYEPRYRGMIRRCVESGTRQFAISACVQLGKNKKTFADYGTMLTIEDWVLLPDGCSILTTVGTRRFQVVSRGEKDGYDTAQIRFLADTPISQQHIKDMEVLHSRVLAKGRRWFSKMPRALQEEIYRTFGEMPEVECDWSTLDDGPAWLWWLLAILPLSKSLQIAILSITSLGKRLKAVEKTLDHLATNSEATPLVASAKVAPPNAPASAQAS
ncbi:LON peptidase N-terminal domain and RING finger protein 3 [Macrosteles quadrilineatus]|uniref:LON peptidase N-terminal domain and RING finger protein 3 n=1 Tax=Macrosteles quadrilineatus TaxID=74068 RepID=UPI0023E2BD25|nr:LON peptidase N-terminal domain and RING finger protein 3 [Macrosteles quadrilineatus]